MPHAGEPTGTGTYDATVLAHPNLLNYWPLDEVGGTTAADDKGSPARNGTSVSSAHVELGAAGAVLFDGRPAAMLTGLGSSRISMGTAFQVPNGPYSLEVWIRNPTALENTNLLGRWGTANGAMLFPTAGGIHLHQVAQTSCFWQCGFGYFQDNRWHHIVGTYDGTTARLYVDGALRASAAYPVTPGTPTATVPFEIGAYSNGTTAEYGGYVAAAALYNAALSLADIEDHYERATTG